MLRRHEPQHILLRAARADAATGLLDLDRLAHMLTRVRGKIIHKALSRVSPLAVPILLEIGRETVYGEAQDVVLAEAAQTLVDEVLAETPAAQENLAKAAPVRKGRGKPQAAALSSRWKGRNRSSF
ncbi:hypothetical protein MPC1_5100001 [Methylocella tundrae]|nr:hypothetical protein MPC1_5100001 [Methylocella tundrae]